MIKWLCKICGRKKKEEKEEVKQKVRIIPTCGICGGQLGLGVPVTSVPGKGIVHKWCAK